MRFTIFITLLLCILLVGCVTQVEPINSRSVPAKSAQVEITSDSSLSTDQTENITKAVEEPLVKPLEPAKRRTELHETAKCGDCEYPVGNICERAVCCNDDDCDDDNKMTDDTCWLAKTPSARCVYKDKDLCQTGSDCNDHDIMTIDICSGIPKRCSHKQRDLAAEAGSLSYNENTCHKDEVVDDVDCMKGATVNCEEKRARFESRLPYSRGWHYFNYNMKIYPDGGYCILEIETTNAYAGYSEEYRAERMATGLSYIQVNEEAYAESDDLKEDYKGEIRICEFEKIDLEALFQDWQDTIDYEHEYHDYLTIEESDFDSALSCEVDEP